MGIPAYTVEDLATRVGDGSVDLTRLAATVAEQQSTIDELRTSVTAMANWINEQIQAQGAAASAASAASVEPASRKKGG